MIMGYYINDQVHIHYTLIRNYLMSYEIVL